MNDRTLFLADEIHCAFVDDFMSIRVADGAYLGNVYIGWPPAMERHAAFFRFTH